MTPGWIPGDDGGLSMIESDGRRLETAYAELRPVLVRRLAAMTRDADAAEDIAQEAFVRLLRETAAGRAPDDPAAWLYRVSANLAASRGRHLTVVERKAAELRLPSGPPDPEAEVVRAEESAAVRDVLRTMPRDDHDALVLAATGFAGPEIAERLGRTPGATRTLLCRARSRMRQQLLAGGFLPG